MTQFGPLVDGEWLAANLDSVHVFDSRSYMDQRDGRQAWHDGRIPGAAFVDLDTELSAPPSQPGGRHPFPSAGSFAAAMGRAGYDGSRPAVVYDDVGGGMAGRLWFMLTLLELPAAVLDGGLFAWPGDLESGPATIAPATFAERAWPTDRLVSADEVAARLERGGVVFDARSHPRYLGRENKIDDRFGHIPGAMSMPWEDNIDDFTGLFRAGESLVDHWGEVVARINASSERPVAYCGSGVTACHDLIALTLQGIEADLYVGSWSEWGADPDRPLETG